MKSIKVFKNSKLLNNLNALIFIVVISLKKIISINISSFIIWILSLFFIFTIIFELKNKLYNNSDNFIISKYKIVGIGRFSFGLFVILLLGKEVLNDSIDYIIFVYCYISYLILGIRIFKRE